jgi:hypothetical protein
MLLIGLAREFELAWRERHGLVNRRKEMKGFGYVGMAVWDTGASVRLCCS